jgi:hypothetical protein
VQRDPRPPASGKAAAILVVALALFSLLLTPLVYGRLQDSLRVSYVGDVR